MKDMFNLVVCILILVLALTNREVHSAVAAPYCLPFGGSCWGLYSTTTRNDYDEAKSGSGCRSKGTNVRLASIQTESIMTSFISTNTELFSGLTGSTMYWVYLKKKGGDWDWRENSETTWDNWFSGQPKDDGHNEDCVAIDYANSHKWYSQRCGHDDYLYLCEDESYTDQCAAGICQNGATCTNRFKTSTNGGYECACVAGYNGNECQIDINECASSPCSSPGGTCIDGVNGYICSCTAGYTGNTCQTNINECASIPCQNGAICNDAVNMYTCTCVAGYTGIHCETDIDECASGPCQNGATCNDQVNGYTCTCVPGYTGTFCQTNINECASNPCQNGAACVDQVNQYICNCVTGFIGVHCETNIDECASSPCVNNGTCVDGVNGYTCTCVTNWYGTHCESVNGQWGLWGSYGDCTVTCGPGVKIRSRQCDDPPPDGNGLDCIGDEIGNSSCGLPRCPYHCYSPPSIGNGVITANNTKGAVLLHGTVLTYTCQAGYYINGDARGISCNDGNWTGVLPTCFYFIGKPSEVMNYLLWSGVGFALILIAFVSVTLYFLIKFYTRRRKYEKEDEKRMVEQEKIYARRHGLPWPMKNTQYKAKPLTTAERMFNEAIDSNKNRWNFKLFKEPSFVPPPINDAHPWIEPGKPQSVSNLQTHVVVVKKKKKGNGVNGRTISPSSIVMQNMETIGHGRPDIIQ